MCFLETILGRERENFLSSEHVQLFLPIELYNPSKGTSGELQSFIKLFTRLKTRSNVQNNYQKILQKCSFTCLEWLRGIEYQSNLIFDCLNQESNINWVIQKLQIKFLDRFDRSSKSSTDQTYWISNFHSGNSRKWIFTLSSL